LASLAVLRADLNKAVRFFQIALEANREDLDAALIGLCLDQQRRAFSSGQCVR
jgi:hypothetical protein